jgi:hypothetical protein
VATTTCERRGDGRAAPHARRVPRAKPRADHRRCPPHPRCAPPASASIQSPAFKEREMRLASARWEEKKDKNVDEVNKRNQAGCTENERRHVDEPRRNMD